jgi:hypothetical protein
MSSAGMMRKSLLYFLGRDEEKKKRKGKCFILDLFFPKTFGITRDYGNIY